jgi:hypothetical protein
MPVLTLSRSAAFVLNCVMRSSHPTGRHAVQNPATLRVRPHMTLHEDGAFVWIETYRQVQSCHLTGQATQGLRRWGYRDRMHVDDAEIILFRVLVGDLLPHGPKIIAKMQYPRWLNTGEHARSVIRGSYGHDCPHPCSMVNLR